MASRPYARVLKYTPVGELRRSIRVRLTLWYVGLLALVLVAFSVGVFLFLIAHINAESSDLEHTYREELYGFASNPSLVRAPLDLKHFNRDSSYFGTLGIYYQSRLDESSATELAIDLTPQGEGLLQDLAAKGLVTQRNPGCQATPDNHLACAWLVKNKHHELVGAVAMLGSLSGAIQSENELQTALIIGIPVSLFIALVGGWMLASRALFPIEQLRLTAQSITATDLSRRIGMNRDDELGRLARTLDQMIAGLDSAFTEQRRLTADVSHELRTPLSVIQAQASLALKRSRSPDEYARVIHSIQEETERMSRIVEDLLLLARAEAGQEVLEQEPIRLDVIVRWAVGQLQDTAAEREVDVHSNLKPVMMLGDADRLRQMTLNLLHNAVKYTDPGGKVRIRVAGRAGSAILTVSDTGRGIDAESLPHIFERFYVVDRARSQGGSGLGLSIAHWIVEAHGGAISVASERGIGTTFTVTFPIETADRVDRGQSGDGIAITHTKRLGQVTVRPPSEVES